jgi:hypothetical protein
MALVLLVLFFFAGRAQVIFEARRAARLAAFGAGIDAPLAVQVLAMWAFNEATLADGPVAPATVAHAFVTDVIVAGLTVVPIVVVHAIPAVMARLALPIVQGYVWAVGVVGL